MSSLVLCLYKVGRITAAGEPIPNRIASAGEPIPNRVGAVGEPILNRAGWVIGLVAPRLINQGNRYLYYKSFV